MITQKNILMVCWTLLKNLQTDYLDVFLLWQAPLMQADEIAEAV
jgi:predicted oxidoreductase